MTDLVHDTTPRLGSTTPLPKIISVDDHIVEPAHLWQTWLPSRFRDRGPRAERRGIGEMEHIGGGTYRQTFDPDGPPADCWVYEDLVYINKRHVAAVGFDRDDMTMSPITYDEMRPGCYEPKARMADNDANWVEASLCFPSFPRFCGQTFLEAKDRELAGACVVAYNDFMVEEWCGDSGGKLLPLCIIPLWDADLAAAEVRRNAARGVRAVCFSEIPPHLGLPSIHGGYWDPLFAACEETGTVVCMHIGSSSKMPATSADAPVAVAATLSFGNAMASLTDYLFSGVLVRFPQLRLAYSEGQIGWLPYILERADDVWREHRAWGGVKDIVPEAPSTYFRRQVYGCFFRDQHGLDSLGVIGADRITFETDYPHTDSTWPDTRQVAEQMVQHLSDEDVYAIMRGNAIEMLGLDLAVKLGDVVNSEAAHWGKPLDGVRVLALEQMQALPYATQLLGRLGAEVVKVEAPGTGDLGRSAMPAMTDPAGRGVGATFMRNNLSKRSVVIDLKQPAGHDLVLQLAPRFDVVAENFRAGAAERLGVAYRDIAAVHDRVVYLSISGFGRPVQAGGATSPYDGWPALASIVEAMSGAYEFKRPEGQPPIGAPMGGLGDIVTALFAVIGTLAALRQRDRTGRGQQVDVAMLDAMVAVLDVVPNFWSMGAPMGVPWPGILHGFRAKDGWFMLQVLRPHQWPDLARAIGRPEWADDPRFATPQGWLDHLESDIRPALESWAADKSKRDASEALNAAGLVAGPVATDVEVVADPHLATRHMLVEHPRSDGEDQPVLIPGLPVKFADIAEGPESRVPWLGEHTDDVLAQELGLGPDELAALRSDGVIG